MVRKDAKCDVCFYNVNTYIVSVNFVAAELQICSTRQVNGQGLSRVARAKVRGRYQYQSNGS